MSAFRWVAALRFLGQLVSWLSTIIVIRFLAPEDFGVIALSEVFRNFFVYFSIMGLGQGLVKVEKLTPALVRKTLGLLVLINTGLFVIQFLSAPFVAAFYGNADLEIVLRVMAFIYLLVPWTSVPSSLIARELDHKRTSKITFASSVLGSALSLMLAYLGFGYWAIITAIFFIAIFNCVGFNFLIRYPRTPSFVLKGAGEVFRFGALIAIADILFVAYTQVDVGLAGKYFSVAEIGLYGVATQLAVMLMTKSIPLFNVVAFPAFARMSQSTHDSNDYLLTTLRFATILVFPVCVGVAMVSEDLIGLVLGDNWTQISPIFNILVVTVPIRIVAYIITPALLAAGGARIDMVNALITFCFVTAAVLLLMPRGLEGVALAWSLTSLCLFLLTVVRGGRLLGIPVRRLLATLYPALPVTLLMCLVIYLAGALLPGVSGVIALYKIPLGFAVYVLAFWLFYRQRGLELIRVGRRLIGR